MIEILFALKRENMFAKMYTFSLNVTYYLLRGKVTIILLVLKSDKKGNTRTQQNLKSGRWFTSVLQ